MSPLPPPPPPPPSPPAYNPALSKDNTMGETTDSLSLDAKISSSLNFGEEPPKEESPSSIEKIKKSEHSTLYPKILKLHDFLHATKDLGPLTSIHLTGSVKLHGTHADIVFSSGSDEVRLQSRNQLALTPGVADNCGFAAFVAGMKKVVLLDLRNRVLERYRTLNTEREVEGDVILAGEWCGKGVQKKVAISNLEKFFAIVSINISSVWVPDWEYADICTDMAGIYHIGKAGFFEHELFFDNVDASEAKIRQLTDEVEAECPFAKTLGQSGLGEGKVWKATKHCYEPKFWFKSKGDLLAVSSVSKLPASAVDMENRERVGNFARAIVTENRLEQGWDVLEQKNASSLGPFLKWVQSDCLVEEKREMEGLNISKAKLNPAIAAIAKSWFWKRIGR